MPVPPERPPNGFFDDLDPDQLDGEEEGGQVTEPPVTPTLRKRSLQSGDSESEDEGGPGREDSSSQPSSATHSNAGTLQMEQTVRRTAKRLKLSNEDTAVVERFSQVNIIFLLLLSNN